ncbi:lysozyme inhibitor LprI family protein [Xanthomonas sp. 3075]|uniref:lysozyme inhibitor LprI family protein n=1 Tax=Xanthomonas sp. 3075 TaxID=3035315 RepID=UPI00160DF3D6|nr:lysozyme inhibitor LprI family protein [Xanthomonas sp. 3075]MBB4130917.1 uncharacterized protein [Xanthomonas sp. 3075]
MTYRVGVLRAVVGGALLLGVSGAWAASFDCKQASTAVEKRLCAVPALGNLDDQLDESYRALVETTPRSSVASVRDQQRAWLRQRNACAQDAQLDDCLQRTLKARADVLTKALTAQQHALDRIIAGIPTAPAAAAAQLRQYDGGLASAWLVYLHRFVPAAGVGASDARARFAAASAALRKQDTVAAQLLDTDEPADAQAAQARDLTLLRLWIERSDYGVTDTLPNGRPYVHCFVFAQQGEAAYEAMGPMYGSSRDIGAPICQPQPGLFDQPAWKRLYQAFSAMIERASAETGTMRYADFAAWRVLSLQATVSPTLFLSRPQGAEPRRDPAAAIAGLQDAALWSQAERTAALAALQPARAATARWLIEHKAMQAAQADRIAAAVVAEWVDARIAFGEGPE